jgi:Ca2+-binding RTX toxin-like protein
MVLVALGVLLVSGVALAATVNCAPLAFRCTGTDGNDTINGTVRTDDIYARRGDDVVRSYGAQDFIEDGAGDDKVYGGAGNDIFALLDQNAGNDRYYGGDDHDTVWGGPGRDVVFGGNGPDFIVVGGVGVSGDGPRDRVSCGPGKDRVIFTSGRFGGVKDVVAADCEKRIAG